MLLSSSNNTMLLVALAAAFFLSLVSAKDGSTSSLRASSAPLRMLVQPQQAVVYHFSVTNPNYDNEESCDYPAPAFTLTCGNGGVIELLDENESFGLTTDECTAVNERTISCAPSRTQLWNPFNEAAVVFRCIGRSVEAWRATAVVTQVDNVDCPSGAWFPSTYAGGRRAFLSHSCEQQLDPFNVVTSPSKDLQDVACQVGDQQADLYYGFCMCDADPFAVQLYVPCEVGTLPPLTLSVQDTFFDPDCLFAIEEDDPSTTFATTISAHYLASAFWTSVEIADCVLSDDAQATLACGTGGVLQVLPHRDIMPTELEPFDDDQLIEFGCQRESADRVTCGSIENNQILGALVMCTGDTTEAVSFELELDPVGMTCAAGRTIAGSGYGVGGFQLCPQIQNELFPNAEAYSAAFYAHECFPSISYDYNGLEQEVAVDTDNDGTVDAYQRIYIPINSCQLFRTSCEAQDLCDANGGQELSPVRIHFPADRIRLDCLVVA